MGWSIEIARVAGIRVRVHITFLLLIAWLGFGYYHLGGSRAAIVGVTFLLLLFGCVLLHEFGHALAAQGFGIRTPDITLLPIGGVARLTRMPRKPMQELTVALAGPAVNVMIVLGLASVIGWRSLLDEDAVATSNVLSKLLAINVALILFNMLPAFPMDGGRVLRALLAMPLGHLRATRIAANIGRVCAVLFAIVSFRVNPMLLFIAVFIYTGASQELAEAEARETERTAMPLPEVLTGPQRRRFF